MRDINLEISNKNLLSVRTVHKLIKQYEDQHQINILNKTRRRETVVPRQCFGLILTHKFNFTLSRAGGILDCDHATVLHGNKNVKQFVELKYNDYVDAMLNWKLIFDDNKLYFNEAYSVSSELEARITNMIQESIELNILKTEDASIMLKNVLKTLKKKYRFVTD